MNPPVRINGLPTVVDYAFAGGGRIEHGWCYYPSNEEAVKEGLRIEIVTYTNIVDFHAKERHEARLVNGPSHAPKHLHVIRLKHFTVERISKAVWTLREEFFQKGW